MITINDIRNDNAGRALLSQLEEARRENDTTAIAQVTEELRMGFGLDL